jgi:hypothetical protein
MQHFQAVASGIKSSFQRLFMWAKTSDLILVREIALGGQCPKPTGLFRLGNGCGPEGPSHGVATPGGFSNMGDTATENNNIPSNNSLIGPSSYPVGAQDVGDVGTVGYRQKNRGTELTGTSSKWC